MNDNIDEIDLSSIDWSKLSKDDYQKLSENLHSKNKLISKNKERKKRVSDINVHVKIRNVSFEIPNSLFTRLKNLNDGKPKEKLIDEIFENYQPIQSL